MTYENFTQSELIALLEQQAETINNLQADLEAERQKSEAYRYDAQLLDFVLDPVMSSDKDFNLVSWNRAAEDLYGWTADEAIGQNATELLETHYTDGSSPESQKEQFRQDGFWRGEMIHHDKDGTPIPIMGTTAMMYDDNGELRGYVTVLRDMTEKVQAEQALRESEERYRIISELMSDYAFFFRVEDDGEWHWVWTTDEAFERITGYPQGKADTTYGLYHPDDVARVQADVARTVAGENTEGEYRIITHSGEQKWIYIHRRPLWDEAGENVIGFYGAGKDITARKKKDEQLLAYRREEERMQILQEFIRDASHDLKTPLSTINTSIYLLRRYTSDEKQHRQIDKLEDHVKRLVNLIEDMFDMSRLDLMENLYREQVNLSLYLKDMVRSFGATASEKNIQIIPEIDSESLTILADMTSMQQAISNIIENAIVFSLDDKKIYVRAYQTDDNICIEIEDQGIGIAEDDLPHIFERFYRVDKSRNTGTLASTGLGLSIAKKVIDLHGGHIQVSSIIGEGTTFTICLPQGQSATTSD